MIREYGKDNKYKGKESKLQVSCYRLLHYHCNHPLVWHTPNQRITSVHYGKALKAQGVRSGIPDLLAAEARHGYHGLAIELKVQGGRLQDTQKDILRYFDEKGWFAAIVWSIDGMNELIKEYFRN